MVGTSATNDLAVIKVSGVSASQLKPATFADTSSVVVGQAVVAVPGAGTEVPIWLLGSSLFSARLAAARGLPYAFAAHFAPALLHQALAVYRANYQPSARWPRPYVMVGVPLVAAESDQAAELLASSAQPVSRTSARGSSC